MPPPPKPTTRQQAESLNTHLSRYTEEGLESITFALGVTGVYQDDQQGFTITIVHAGTAAERAGLMPGDAILEVDGVPIGHYGRRTYFIWKRYPFSQGGNIQFTIFFQDVFGEFRYYYPTIQLDPVGPITYGGNG